MTERGTPEVSHVLTPRSDIDPDLQHPLRPYGRIDKPFHVPVRHLVTVFVGGVAGTLARYGMGRLVPSTHPWPWSILLVNLIGSLVLGWVLEHLAAQGPDRGRLRGLRLLLGVGFCGAFTTYSAFATAAPVLDVRPDPAGVGWIVITLLGCALTAWLGMELGTRSGARRADGGQ